MELLFLAPPPSENQINTLGCDWSPFGLLWGHPGTSTRPELLFILPSFGFWKVVVTRIPFGLDLSF